MLQSEVNRAVAKVTGKSVKTIAQLGFSIADPEGRAVVTRNQTGSVAAESQAQPVGCDLKRGIWPDLWTACTEAHEGPARSGGYVLRGRSKVFLCRPARFVTTA